MGIQKSSISGTSSITGIFIGLAVFGLLFASCKQLTLPSTAAEPGKNTFTVSFESNGGSLVVSQAVPKNGKVVEPRRVYYDGFILEGWFLDNETFALKWDFDEDFVTENITLYAQWTEISFQTFIVDFIVTNGARTAPPQIIIDGERASQPQGLILNGWYLDCWYTEDVFINQWNFDDDIVIEDITLYAQWIENESDWFTVTFDSNGGTYVADQLRINGGKATEPAIVTKEGHVFEGWYVDNDTFTRQWDFENTPIMEDLTLYAKWFDLDFGMNLPSNIFNVATTTEWEDAASFITGGGDDQNYIINIIDNFVISGSTAARGNTFGSAGGIKVSIRGEGRILNLADNGNILRIGAGQTVVLWNPILRGKSNNTSLVYVGGTFIVNGGEISGNTASASNNSFTYVNGGGVQVANGGALILNSGKISGNTVSTTAYTYAYGGGVYVVNGGTFTMNGGEISGNTVSATNYTYAYGGGAYVANGGAFTMNGGEILGNAASGNNNTRGGGVYTSGIFRISTGTIYGSGMAAGIRNTASSGAALYRGSTGTAERGTFNGDDWISENTLNTNNYSIVVSD
jgi:uncharacterized repeat protein (TIGR02543 family)